MFIYGININYRLVLIPNIHHVNLSFSSFTRLASKNRLRAPRFQRPSCLLCFCRRKNLNLKKFTIISLAFLRLEGSFTERLNVTLGKFRVKVRHVDLRFQVRHERGLYFFCQQSVEVYSLKPWVILNFCCPSFCAQSILRFFLKKPFEKVPQFVTNKNWYIRIGELNLIEKLLSALGVEGREADNHFVDDRSEAPPIHRLAVALLVEYLGS